MSSSRRTRRSSRKRIETGTRDPFSVSGDNGEKLFRFQTSSKATSSAQKYEFSARFGANQNQAGTSQVESEPGEEITIHHPATAGHQARRPETRRNPPASRGALARGGVPR